jgi:hypothetical protein
MPLLDQLRPVAVLLAAMLTAVGWGGQSASAADQWSVQSFSVPAASGSVGPNLAAGPDGTVILSWIEPEGDRHRLRYSVLADGAWGDPREVSEGTDWFVNWADFPSVVPLSETLWAAHWLVRQPAGGYAYDVMLSLSQDGGVTWAEPVMPHDDATPTEHGFVSIFRHGDAAGLLWLDGRNMIPESAHDDGINGMTLRAATIGADMTITNAAQVDGLICDCCQTDVAVTDAGPIAVYRNRTEDEVRDIYVARMNNDEWQPGRPVADDGWNIAGCPVNGPAVAAAGRRVAVAWFTAADDRPRVRVARSDDGGAGFSAPVAVVNEGVLGRVGVALLPGDRLAVSWLCRPAANNAAVCLRTVSPTGERGPVHVLSGDQHVPAFSVPQLLQSGDWLVSAWTVEVQGETGISSGRIAIATLD